MKTKLPILLTCTGICLFSTFLSLGATFKAKESVNINQDIPDDLYAVGGNIELNAAVFGDLILAGGNINVNDTVHEDVMMAGGKINQNGYVKDDIRVAGGEFQLNANCGDDVIVAGGEITIQNGSVINGDLVITGGTVRMNGEVLNNVLLAGGEMFINGKIHGGLESKGGQMTIDGQIDGPVTLATGHLKLGDNARFNSTVNYWTQEGEVNFGNKVSSGKAVFDDSLAFKDEEAEKDLGLLGLGLGIGVFGMLMLAFTAAAFTMLIIHWLFRSYLQEAAGKVQELWLKSFGMGALYLVSTPVIAFFVIITIIGLPLGVFVLANYAFSLLAMRVVTALVAAYWIQSKLFPDKGHMMGYLTGLGVFLALKFLSFIPFLGGLITLVTCCIAYGAILLVLFNRTKTKTPAGSVPPIPSNT